MTVQQMKEKLERLIAKGYGEYTVYTMYKNCTYIDDIDKENESVTFA